MKTRIVTASVAMCKIRVKNFNIAVTREYRQRLHCLRLPHQFQAFFLHRNEFSETDFQIQNDFRNIFHHAGNCGEFMQERRRFERNVTAAPGKEDNRIRRRSCPASCHIRVQAAPRQICRIVPSSLISTVSIFGFSISIIQYKPSFKTSHSGDPVPDDLHDLA